MAARRQYIHELATKLNYLRELTPSKTWTEVEEATRIWPATFDKSYVDSMLGSGHQEQLAEFFGFGIDWEQWRDPARSGRNDPTAGDSAKAFIKRHGECGGAKLLKARPVEPTTEAGAQSASSRSVADEVKADNRGTTRTPLGTMAQVELELGQPAGPGANQILVEVSCHATNIQGSSRRFSVRRAVLAIDCKDARGRRDGIAGVNGLPITLSNPHGETTFVWCGSTKLLRWEVTASGVKIGYLLFDAGIIEGLSHGDVLRVSLSAWLKHIDVVDGDEEPTFGILDASERLLQQPDEPLTIEQQRLIQHINKLRLPVDANGYAEIAAHELDIVRKP